MAVYPKPDFYSDMYWPGIYVDDSNYPYVIKYFLDQGIDIRKGGIIFDPNKSIEDQIFKKAQELIDEYFPNDFVINDPF